MSLTIEHARDEIAFLTTMTEDQLLVQLGLQIDRHTQSLGLGQSEIAAAAAPLLGGATPANERPGFLKRLGQNFLKFLEKQFHSLICNDQDPDNAKVRSALALGAEAAAYSLAVIVTSAFGIGFGIAAAAATIIAKRVLNAGHGAFCATWTPDVAAKAKKTTRKR